MKLKYRLEKWERALVFQVLEMDERFRRKFPADELLTHDEVRSFSCPEINYSFIFLWGTDKIGDMRVSHLRFDDNEKRDARFEEIHAQLADWAANWEGWKEVTPFPSTFESGVYIL